MIGIEKEYFVTKDGKVVEPELMSSIPRDDCGFLAEIRAEPASDEYTVVSNLIAEEWRLRDQISETKDLRGIKLVETPSMNFKMEDVLKFYDAQMIKQKSKVGNIYGKELKTTVNNKTAGLHLNFSNHKFAKDGKTIIPLCMDMVDIIQQLDNAFKKEILAAKRPLGCYRIKTYGDGKYGFEYRSLPNNIDLRKLVKVLKKLDW